jgi:hypothetical protein
VLNAATAPFILLILIHIKYSFLGTFVGTCLAKIGLY